MSIVSETAEQSMPFSVQLRQASRKTHSISDALVNSRLINLLVDQKLYARALGCFYYIFKCIENGLDLAARCDSRLERFHEASKPLYRSEAISADLEYFLGEEWQRDVEIHSKPYVEEYLKHIGDLVEGCRNGQDGCCVLVAAHSVTQSMAVVSGGLILSSIISKGLGLESSLGSTRKGIETFSFVPEQLDADKTQWRKENKNVAGKLKDRLKNALDEELYPLLSQQERMEFIKEHCEVFRLNNGVISSYRVGYLAPLRSFALFSYRQLCYVFGRSQGAEFEWRLILLPLLGATLFYYLLNKLHN